MLIASPSLPTRAAFLITITPLLLTGCGSAGASGGRLDVVRDAAAGPSGALDAKTIVSISATVAMNETIMTVSGVALTPCPEHPASGEKGTLEVSCGTPGATGSLDYTQSSHGDASDQTLDFAATIHHVCSAGTCLDGAYASSQRVASPADSSYVRVLDGELTQGSFTAQIHHGVAQGVAGVSLALVAIDEAGDTYTFVGKDGQFQITGANGTFACTFTDEHGTKGSCKGPTTFSF